ncbi:hypothetical protein THAOC_22791 [Thalassiosira oceanica]|uniref:Uncharacterized protein n=1 Tax=Thalassiosira oceanica TaxID=159749 RepID=K0RXP3_THAOC|nr:hypothetical protein THAOC_22791 [Thalassiosira oceanica]|eukprot:EJK57194.1 hypothetical protein THAOC_22791 [Thalassiosira oceanica]
MSEASTPRSSNRSVGRSLSFPRGGGAGGEPRGREREGHDGRNHGGEELDYYTPAQRTSPASDDEPSPPPDSIWRTVRVDVRAGGGKHTDGASDLDYRTPAGGSSRSPSDGDGASPPVDGRWEAVRVDAKAATPLRSNLGAGRAGSPHAADGPYPEEEDGGDHYVSTGRGSGLAAGSPYPIDEAGSYEITGTHGCLGARSGDYDSDESSERRNWSETSSDDSAVRGLAGLRDGGVDFHDYIVRDGRGHSGGYGDEYVEEDGSVEEYVSPRASKINYDDARRFEPRRIQRTRYEEEEEEYVPRSRLRNPPARTGPLAGEGTYDPPDDDGSAADYSVSSRYEGLGLVERGEEPSGYRQSGLFPDALGGSESRGDEEDEASAWPPEGYVDLDGTGGRDARDDGTWPPAGFVDLDGG